jgi:hypothetical protein
VAEPTASTTTLSRQQRSKRKKNVLLKRPCCLCLAGKRPATGDQRSIPTRTVRRRFVGDLLLSFGAGRFMQRHSRSMITIEAVVCEELLAYRIRIRKCLYILRFEELTLSARGLESPTKKQTSVDTHPRPSCTSFLTKPISCPY